MGSEELNEASAVEQAGLEFSIFERMLTRKNTEGWYRKQLHGLIIGPVLKSLCENPKLVCQELLPKLRKFREQLDRSIERIESQLKKEDV